MKNEPNERNRRREKKILRTPEELCIYIHSQASRHTHTNTFAFSQISYSLLLSFWLYIFDLFVTVCCPHVCCLLINPLSESFFFNMPLCVSVCVTFILYYFANLTFFFRLCDYTLLLHIYLFLFIHSFVHFSRLFVGRCGFNFFFLLHLPLCTYIQNTCMFCVFAIIAKIKISANMSFECLYQYSTMSVCMCVSMLCI